jgi:hypothetical protein
MVNDIAVQDFVNAIKEEPTDTNTTYNATVSRVDKEGVVWVNLHGSDKETPTASTSSEVKKGDSVNVNWRNNKLYIGGNYSNPSAGVTRVANVEQDAANALTAAENAEQDAARAHEAAEQAEASAEEAKTQATRATRYANDSLSQLSIVEDVVGTLNWITTHATYKATEDTEVREGKWYFTKSGSTYNVVIAPSGNPSEQEWYEVDSIDEAVSNYVASHLALTSAGLWVTKDNQGYKILLANDGMKVYDNAGHIVSTFGESITFDAERPQYIGGEDAYIIFHDTDNDNVPDTITIGGNIIMSGSDTTLSDMLASLQATAEGTLIYDHDYVLNSDKTIATFTAHVYRGGQDVTYLFDNSQFTWYYKTESSADPLPLNNNTSNNPQNSGKTISVELSLMKYGGEIVGKFTTSSGRKLLRSNGDALTDANNRSLLAQTTDTGYSVRVRDLEKATTIYPTDSLLLVQPEAEKLATIEALANVIWAKYDIRIEDEPLLQGDNYYEYLGLESLTNSEIEELLENSDLPIRPSFSDIPRYVTEEARSVSRKVLAVQNENTVTSIVWADAHHTKDQVTGWQVQTNISTLHAAMGASLIAKACKIDFAAYCGDYTFGSGQTTFELFEGQCEEMNSYMDIAFYDIPTLYCVGNHDTGEYYLRDNTEGSLYGAENVYRLIGGKNDDGITVMGSTRYGYCYRDIPEKKVRIINLNTVEGETDGGYTGGQCSDTQLLWFAQTLYNVGASSDWGIFVVSHYPLDYGNTCRAGNILYQYINGGSVTYNGTTVNFGGHNLAKFIAQYHGHTHCLKVDRLHYIVNQQGTEFNAYRLATPSGTFYRNNDYAGHPVYGIDFGESVAYTKTADTAEDTAFVVNVYDPSTEVIHSFCYGAGYDRIVGVGDITYSSVSLNLTNVTSSNTDEYVVNGGNYSTTLTPSASYSMTSVTVTMGGTDITNSAYNSDTHVISIASVSGDISIMATASKEIHYTNLIPTSTDSSGAIYNGIGYKDGARINSSGEEAEGRHMSATGFIPYTHGHTIRLGGTNIAFNEYGCVMYFYKSDKSAISGADYNKVGNANFGMWDTTEDNTAFAFTPSATHYTDAAYIRISASVRNAGDTGSGMIVTIDERIE